MTQNIHLMFVSTQAYSAYCLDKPFKNSPQRILLRYSILPYELLFLFFIIQINKIKIKPHPFCIPVNHTQGCDRAWSLSQGMWGTRLGTFCITGHNLSLTHTLHSPTVSPKINIKLDEIEK